MVESPWLGIGISGFQRSQWESFLCEPTPPSPALRLRPYDSEEEQERLLGLYQYLHSRAHNASTP